jgi:hypothetical protein
MFPFIYLYLIQSFNSHLAFHCKNKRVTCPEPNCGCVIFQQLLQEHLNKDCKVRKARVALSNKAKLDKKETFLAAAAAASQPTSKPVVVSQSVKELKTAPVPVYCPKCHESMPSSHLTRHFVEECLHRPVQCPHFGVGCHESAIPLIDLPDHLKYLCRVEVLRQQMIAQSAVRHEKLKCSGCGEMVALMNLKQHDSELCKSRLVPCRNQCFGCNVLVRVDEREKHEIVSGKQYGRHCLYFDGNGAAMKVNESDITGSWTAEVLSTIISAYIAALHIIIFISLSFGSFGSIVPQRR